jgi:hypothetical protein
MHILGWCRNFTNVFKQFSSFVYIKNSQHNTVIQLLVKEPVFERDLHNHLPSVTSHASFVHSRGSWCGLSGSNIEHIGLRGALTDILLRFCRC